MKQIVEYLLNKTNLNNKESIINGLKNIVYTENSEDLQKLNDFVDILIELLNFKYIKSLYYFLNALIEDKYEIKLSIDDIKKTTNISTKAICLQKVTSQFCIIMIYNLPKAKCLIMLLTDKDITIHVGSESTPKKLLEKIKDENSIIFGTDSDSFNSKSYIYEFDEKIEWVK